MYKNLVSEDELENYCNYDGLLHGGGGYLLGIQTLTVVTMAIWAMATTTFLLWVRIFHRDWLTTITKLLITM